ncbi:alpha/beta fold hydrolase [Phyllobacterium sp. BT25]|uniref:Alpha/beta fold hydrolase n=1 Tax=Phyllobacterium pellucidum TaxID=2740464 RepID=A0A849VTT4_9HYPH|nr:alpha/beta fold hydrolase [Phyllobacterium pellucidum]NTS31557.1 alpha/beta fold hydrolase [Phyllobacterium pellucidum]
MKDIRFLAADGFPLHGHLYEGGGEGPAVLISSAAAVPDAIYRHFAAHLIDLGASKVLTYDYRGVARSEAPSHWKSRLNLKDWGVLDFPAAVDELRRLSGSRPMVGIGHSYGGVALGLSNRSASFERYALLASLSGYYRNTAQPCAMYAKMNLVGVPLTIPFGKLPKWGGLGEAVPGTIFRDWARWCRNPNFLFSDPAVPEAQNFQKVTIPLLSVGITDDVWGTPRAVESLLRRFDNASVLHEMWYSPASSDGAPIGHLGFFRKHQANKLWPAVTDWLLNAKVPDGAALRPEMRAA